MQEASTVFSGCGLGGVSLEGVEVLVGLGLSGRQARVYLALLRCGGGRVKEIAEGSLVHRQEIYRLLSSLSELGLVKQNITVPTTYTPTPIAESVNLLLQQKTGQITLMRQQTKFLIRKYNKPNRLPTIMETKPCFGSVHEADRGRKYQNAIKASEKSIQAVTSWSRFKQLSIHFENQLQDALKKDVAIQIITEKPPNHRLLKWINIGLEKYSNFKLKTIPDTPKLAITIFDQEQLAVAFNPDSSLKKGPDLWTTHPALIIQAQAYFQTVWKQTKN